MLLKCTKAVWMFLKQQQHTNLEYTYPRDFLKQAQLKMRLSSSEFQFPSLAMLDGTDGRWRLGVLEDSSEKSNGSRHCQNSVLHSTSGMTFTIAPPTVSILFPLHWRQGGEMMYWQCRWCDFSTANSNMSNVVLRRRWTAVEWKQWHVQCGMRNNAILYPYWKPTTPGGHCVHG